MKTKNSTKSNTSKKENIFSKVSNYIKDSIQIATLRQPVENALKEVNIKKEILIFVLLSFVNLLIIFALKLYNNTQEPFIIDGLDVTQTVFTLAFILIILLMFAYYIFSIIELHFFSKLLGGKGQFVKTFGSLAKLANALTITYTFPIRIIFSITTIISTIVQVNQIIIPIAELLELILVMPIILINAFLTVKATKFIYKLDTIKAILSSIILPIILEILLLVILLILFAIIIVMIGILLGNVVAY
jgi:hypothetical protein